MAWQPNKVQIRSPALRHDAAEAILIGLCGVIEVEWLPVADAPWPVPRRDALAAPDRSAD